MSAEPSDPRPATDVRATVAPRRGDATIGEAHRRGSTGFRRITLALFAAGLATFTLLYCAQALLPAISGTYRLDPARASLAVSVATGGLAISIIPLSALSNTVGRIRMMTVSLLVAGVLGLAAAFAPSFGMLLVFRALQGIALGGLQAVAMTYLAEEVHPSSLGAATGLYVAGNGIGGMAGRLVASLVADVADWRWALAVIGVLGLCCTLIFRLAIPASRRFTPEPLRARHLAATVGRAFTDTGLIRLYAVGFLLMGCFVTVYNFLGFRLLAAPFHLSATVVGLIFVTYLAGSVSSALAGRLADRYGRPRVFWVTAVVTLAGLALTLSTNLPLVVLGLVVVTGGFFAGHAVASGWAGARGRARKAHGAAVYLLCYYLGSSVGGSVGGLAYGHGGWPATIAYTGGLVAVALLIGITLRTLVPAKRHALLSVPGEG
ncbi:MFS transporter [Actinocatenispora rupis]|uniref:Putative transporter n=1 Tax=Actinocatenispora rupis TaxID=519421 RepID=A0A8J3J514_9ACTN|nr:MFS transporter [Actinocatenispora rupis]GID10257.1 putative transporter [Actinocatenispora rupis]